MTTYEQVVDELVPASPRNLPNRILKAIDNALHLGGLPRSIRATLADIARFVPQASPFESVFAHKKKIAERTGASERTVYRHLQALQEKGLIEVLGQERKSRNGRFAVARIRLTRQAAELLGFVQATFASETPSPTPPQNDVMHSSPSAIMSAGHTLTVPTLSKNQPTTQTKNGLPIDLNWLTGQGVSKWGIFKLMRLAKENQQLLSDIVLVAQGHLGDKRGGGLFGYLAKLCRSTSDFAYAARLQRQRVIDLQQEQIKKEKVRRFRERFRNTTLTTRGQSMLFIIDGKARFAQVIGPKGCSTMPLNDVTEFIDGMETGKLTLATLATENRLLGRG